MPDLVNRNLPGYFGIVNQRFRAPVFRAVAVAGMRVEQRLCSRKRMLRKLELLSQSFTFGARHQSFPRSAYSCCPVDGRVVSPVQLPSSDEPPQATAGDGPAVWWLSSSVR